MERWKIGTLVPAGAYIMQTMPASTEHCPRCRKQLAPLAAFCPRCGLAKVAAPISPIASPKLPSTPPRAKRGVFAGLLVAAAVLLAVMAGVLGFLGYSQISAQPASPAMASPPATPPALSASDSSWLNPQAEHAIFGQSYWVGPNAWTRINVAPPHTPPGDRYRVALEGLDRFIARPDGEAWRQYEYPDPRGLAPYQLSGRCRLLWVKATDGASHWVRVKYERVSGN